MQRLSLVNMNDKSFGIIPLKKGKLTMWEVLLVQHHQGHWSFPKGHAEGKEEPLIAAARELKEETGLSIVQLLRPDPFIEDYQFRLHGHLVFKTVFYFLAVVKGKLSIQKSELCQCRWLPLNEALEQLSFPQGRQLLSKVEIFLSSLHEP